MRLASLIVALGLLHAGAARADEARDTPLGGHRWEVGVAWTIAPSFTAGRVDDAMALGVHAAAGRQLGHWRLAGEYTFLSFESFFTGAGGQLHRVGGAVRYRVGLPMPDAAMETGFYVEAGAGHQRFAWTGGGSEGRRDLAFGLGYELAGGHGQVAGFDVGVRVLAAGKLADGPRMDETLDLAWTIQIGGVLGR